MMNLNRSISHALKASLLTAGLFLFHLTEAAAKPKLSSRKQDIPP